MPVFFSQQAGAARSIIIRLSNVLEFHRLYHRTSEIEGWFQNQQTHNCELLSYRIGFTLPLSLLEQFHARSWSHKLCLRISEIEGNSNGRSNDFIVDVDNIHLQ